MAVYLPAGLSCSMRNLTIVPPLDSLTGDPEPDSPDSPVFGPDRECIKQAVFLSSGQNKFLPFQIHCQRIYPGIMLIVLSEVLMHLGLNNREPKYYPIYIK